MKKENPLKYKSKTNSVVLCCNNVKCPEVFPKDDNFVEIKDDFGQKITISKEQAKMIPQALDIIDKNGDI